MGCIKINRKRVIVIRKIKDIIYEYRAEIVVTIIILLIIGMVKFIKYEFNKQNIYKSEVIKQQFYFTKYKINYNDVDIKNRYEKFKQYAHEKAIEKRKREFERHFKRHKKEKITVNRSNNSNNNRTLMMKATFYTAYCPTGCIGITKTGYNVKNTIYYKDKRIVAVDPDVIPLYSILKINMDEDEFYAVALDTGGNIKGNRIDILVKTRKEAYELGRKDVTVIIIREGKGEHYK